MNAEYLGIVGSIIILISGIMQSEKELRVVNLIGSVLMLIYGGIIYSPSVIFLNGALSIAHLYRLWRIRKDEINAKRNAPE